jgi:hypothetical protein
VTENPIQNQFSFHISLGQIVMSAIGVCLTIIMSFATYEFSQGRSTALETQRSIQLLAATVTDHNVIDAARDSSCRSDLDSTKQRLDRMEIMLERISSRVGADTPPRRNRLSLDGKDNNP